MISPSIQRQLASKASTCLKMRLPVRLPSRSLPPLLLRQPIHTVPRLAFSSSTPRPTTTAATTTPPLTSSTSSTPPPSSPSAQPSPSASSATSPPAYHVGRTASNNLPVYHDTKNGNTRRLTLVRRVSGDQSALAHDLRSGLELPEGDIKVNPVTRHVVIKGYHMKNVKKWLEERGF